MRVLQIHNRALRPGGERNPDHKAGGAEAVIENDRVMLQESGHKVDQLIVDNMDSLRQTSRLRAGLDSIWNRSVAADLQSRLATFEPDVVHVHTPFPLISPVVFRVGARKRRGHRGDRPQLSLLVRTGQPVPRRAALRSLRWEEAEDSGRDPPVLSRQSACFCCPHHQPRPAPEHGHLRP